MKTFRYLTMIFLLFILLAIGCLASGHPATAQGPSYDCSMVAAGSIELLICKDADLSALDRKMAGIYAQASEKAVNEHPPMLKAEQRGWIKGRDECWKSADKKKCVENQYRLRIAELQARYHLLPGNGPFFYVCGDIPGNDITATFFKTDPPTLIAERGDSTSLMYRHLNASGGKYQGRNESFWEHRGEALVTWGHGAPQICSLKPPKNDCSTKRLFINSSLVDCVGVGPQKCMQIKENESATWGSFYGTIENFTFEEGYVYEINVKIIDVENPPADSSSKKYTLLEILSKEKI